MILTRTLDPLAHSFRPSSSRTNETNYARRAHYFSTDQAGESVVRTVICLYVPTNHVLDSSTQKVQDTGFVTIVLETDAQQIAQPMSIN